ncbi:DUF4062 domain-containing protein [Ferruginibacter sp.]
MKDKKLQVFVSSTYTDLIKERQAAVEAILSSGNIPAGMELFSAGDESQMTVIERWIDESDIYLLILGGRYGSIDIKTGKSYTQLEYEYAMEKNKPLFSVVINNSIIEERVKKMGLVAIEQHNPKALELFRSSVLKNLVKFWDDTKDIKIAIHETLSEFGYRKELIGWIRGDNSVDTTILAEQIARLTKENFELTSKLSNPETNSNSLYAGLSFSQLEGLLKEEGIEISQKKINLLDFMITNGASLARNISSAIFNREGINKLMKYRLIESDDMGRVKFTEAGHSFYLKCIVASKS